MLHRYQRTLIIASTGPIYLIRNVNRRYESVHNVTKDQHVLTA